MGFSLWSFTSRIHAFGIVYLWNYKTVFTDEFSLRGLAHHVLPGHTWVTRRMQRTCATHEPLGLFHENHGKVTLLTECTSWHCHSTAAQAVQVVLDNVTKYYYRGTMLTTFTSKCIVRLVTNLIPVKTLAYYLCYPGWSLVIARKRSPLFWLP